MGVMLLYLQCLGRVEQRCPVANLPPLGEVGPVDVGLFSIEELGLVFHTQGDPQVSNAFFTREINCFTSVGGAKECPFGSQFFEAQQFLKWVMEQERKTRGDPALKRWPYYGLDYTVVEMGALDGRTYNNNYFFENQLGWRAVNIEPSRISYPLLVKNRPHSININMAGCLEEGELSFTERKEDLAVSHLTSLTQGGTTGENYTVLCGPISKYLKMLGIDRVELFFLDVEGAELTVLESINFTTLRIHYMIVEMQELYNINDSFSKIRNLLYREGFSLVGKFGWDNKNEFFANKDLLK